MKSDCSFHRSETLSLSFLFWFGISTRNFHPLFFIVKNCSAKFFFFSQVKNKQSPALFSDDLWEGKVGGTKMEVQEFKTPIVISSFIKMKHYSVFGAYERWELTAKMCQ